MKGLVFIHICAVMFWFGVIGVEFLLERQRARSREMGYMVAQLHYRIDLFLEAPAFFTVLITGWMLYDPAVVSTIYLLKVGAGAVAVSANVISLYPVIQRKRAVDRDDHASVLRYSRWIDLTVPLGLPAGLIAFAIGINWLYFAA